MQIKATHGTQFMQINVTHIFHVPRRPFLLPEMMGVVLKQRIRFCDVLFTALIILDIFAALGAIAPLISKESEDLANNQTTVGNKAEAKGSEWLSKGGMEEATTVSVEVFALAVLLLSNLTALLGLHRTEAYLLVPWIFVYLIGICSSYIGATILFVSQINEDGELNTKIVYPLGTAVVFHLVWILVKSVFDDLKSGMGDRSMQQQHYVELSLPSSSEGTTYQQEE